MVRWELRVNTQFVNNLVGSLDQASANQQRLSEEMASGATVNSLDQDPGAAGANVLLSAQMSADDTFSQTAGSVESRLQIGDSVLASVVSQLTSAISLATEGANGTLDAANQQAIATQLGGIRDEVLSLANSTYMGQFIFAGSASGAVPFSLDTTTSPATVTYNGDASLSYVETPDGEQLQTNLPGNEIFTSGPDVLGTLNHLIEDFSSAGGTGAVPADLTALSSAVNYVGQQRMVLDNSLTRLTAAANYNTGEQTQLASAQNNLIAADPAKVATELSQAETQQTALTQIIAAIDKQGTLFDVLQ